MQRKLGRGVAVVGVGKSQFGMFADRDSKVWRDNLDEVAATIRMAIWCRG